MEPELEHVIRRLDGDDGMDDSCEAQAELLDIGPR
jgi:hypothetical protein